MNKEEVYSTVLQIRKDWISNCEGTYESLKHMFDFYLRNQHLQEELNHNLMEFEDELMINCKILFNQILELINSID